MSGMYSYPCWFYNWQREALFAKKDRDGLPIAEQIRQAVTLYLSSGQMPCSLVVNGQLCSGQILMVRVG